MNNDLTMNGNKVILLLKLSLSAKTVTSLLSWHPLTRFTDLDFHVFRPGHDYIMSFLVLYIFNYLFMNIEYVMSTCFACYLVFIVICRRFDLLYMYDSVL